MGSPLTEAVLITAIVAVSTVLVVVAYLLVLLRQGRPLQLSFKGLGIDLKVGTRQLITNANQRSNQDENS